MEEIINVVVQNGLGVGSFIFLLIYIYNDKKESNLMLKKISDTLFSVNISLNQLTTRMEKIEEKVNGSR